MFKYIIRRVYIYVRKDDLMKKFILVLVFAFAFVGCQKANTTTPTDTNAKNETQVTDTTDEKATDQTAAENISLEDALKVFTDKYPESNIEDISFDVDNKVAKYEIEAFDESNEYDMEISSKDGSIIKDNFKKDNTANKKAIDTALVSKVDNLVAATIKDAGSDYYLDSYSIDYEETGAYTELDIEVKDSNGKDIEYRYNMETGELIKKDL